MTDSVAPGNSLDSFPVASIMAKNVYSITEDQTVLDACRGMNDRKIGSVVVVRTQADQAKSSHDPIGIITERDIVRHIATKLIGTQTAARDVMSTPVVTIKPEASLADAIQLMQSKNFRRLVVVDGNGRMAGIVTDRDIFRAISRRRELLSGLTEQGTMPAANAELLERLKMEALGELFSPKRA